MGEYFDEPIGENVLPAGLKLLKFGNYFDQLIGENVLPAGLESLRIGHYYNQQIERNVLPSGLRSIVFDFHFNQPIGENVLPSKLQSIYFGKHFNQPLDNIPEKTKLYICNNHSKMTRNYTYFDYAKSNLEIFKKEKEVLGEIYVSEINNKIYYMIDVEINKETLTN